MAKGEINRQRKRETETEKIVTDWKLSLRKLELVSES